ncbi:MAG: glycoside hydrolase family 2 protein, partial [Lachnospiraceae bacterium]|nr:glycoside hydrolase family 2 protein [Lachnospiraceae bacterium]
MTGQRVYLNNDWGFTEEYSEELLRSDYDESGLEKVRLPHTCKETPFHYFDEHIYQMVSGYRKVLEVPEAWRGKKLILTIDGAAHKSEVFVNGEKVGEHHCGYTAFSMDISEKLHYGGQNTLVVKVDSRETANIPPFGYVVDYMTYGGIYRDVYLDIKNEHYLQDVFVTTKIPRANVERTTDRGKVISEITLNTQAEGLSIRQSIKKKEDDDYRQLGECFVQSDKISMEYKFKNVILWDLEHPE